MRRIRFSTKSVLLASISATALTGLAAPAMAQDDTTQLDEVIVTATRREMSVQDAPINIAAVGSEQMEQMNVTNLAELAGTVPGVHLVDQGGRTSDRIVVRGLNVDSLNQTDVLGNNAGNIVATYIGEIPMYIDMRLHDLERVEFLLGPQGTLYGVGTMGGAIRYIPTKPRLGVMEGEVRGSLYGLAHAKDASYDFGATLNLPLGDTFALRGSIDYLEDSGFIDYNYVVRQPGVTNPSIVTPGAPGYDLVQHPDANGEETLTARIAARWQPTDALDVNLTYYYQNQKSEGRTISNWRQRTLPTGKYETSLRVLEPNERENHLIALEATYDLGFAELTSATGYSRFKEVGQRDQTNLLITLEYSYEAFPALTAFTLEHQDDENFTHEMRLVSQGEGPISWIVGGFYNRYKSNGDSSEFTPGFSQYVLDAWGTGGALRPDALEYYAPGSAKLEEKAAFGEISWQINDRWQITGGTRYYDYALVTNDATDLPLLFTSIAPDGRGPNDIVLEFNEDGQKQDGFLWKFNTSYELTPDANVYFTYSQGYRLGGGNGIAPCPEPLGDFQNVCALPDEIAYRPDKTINYEVGLKTQWMDGRLTLNGSAYYIEWKDPQLLSATVNGSGTIFRNGEGAETKGFDISFNALVNENLTLRGSYAYTDAELTALAPDLISTIPDPNLPLGPGQSPFGTIRFDGLKGDRLPGSPKHQATFFAHYEHPLENGWNLNFDYGVRAIGNIYTRVGNREGGITLPSYWMHNAAVTLEADRWKVSLFADNLFDEFAESGVTGSPRHDQTVVDENGDTVYFRGFFTNVLTPRKVGVRFTAKFGG
ncbi:MAG TPA: TonB-dependent receptor [Phenylobacterium sp.]|nr:TonB-dependent receptor [Phenylobacterium sp.]